MFKERKNVKNYFKNKLMHLFLLTFISLNISQNVHSQNLSCQNLFANYLITKNVNKELQLIKSELNNYERTAAAEKLLEFANKFNLPFKWISTGPEDRKIKRLYVAIDISKPEIIDAYRNTFNLETPLINPESGTLVLEYVKESIEQPEHYVPAIMRRWADPNKQGYRWGIPDPYISSYKYYFEDWMLKSRKSPDFDKTGIAAFVHLIELNQLEKENIIKFLENPELRAPCKSDNCVAWQTGIELGKTDKEVNDLDRKFLFSELGISRTVAHFEIGRRLLHAANQRHNAIGVFVNGALGLATFNEALEKNLVPEPKIPFQSILKNYQAKFKPALAAIEGIPDGAKIFLPIAAGASPEAVSALVEYSSKLKLGVDLHVLVNGVSANEYRKGIETTDGKFRVHALFLGGNLRELYSEKKINVIPGNLSDFTKYVKDPKQLNFKYDVIIVRVSPADINGYHSLGPNHDMIMSILKFSPNIKIIAEINPNIPFTTGDNKIHTDTIFKKFNSNSELAGPAVVPPSEVDSQIGSNIGSLIENGSTLQIGIGNVFSGVPEGLKKYKVTNLKISTEMFGDAMMEIMNLGIARIAETGFAYGSKNLYSWLNNNLTVKFKSTEEINSPGRVAKINKFHAVNTALQVNLFGESNATMSKNGRISSPGGQVEFMSGAARSNNGKAIIAIRSTAKEGTISSIVVNLYKGPITTPHESVTHVVTEYGIAELRGKNERERAISLINIAHPKFREELLKDAISHNILTPSDSKDIKL